jgi:protein EFR3
MVAKWCQSKHVRLITKCYPPRTASPPKPNSSELSYLTYYAFTTPSKLKKVGRYLEHRAHKGLANGRTGYSRRFLADGRDVTVTLDICTALIKKCFRDLGLFASNIMAILDAVISDSELILMEHSVLMVGCQGCS